MSIEAICSTVRSTIPFVRRRSRSPYGHHSGRTSAPFSSSVSNVLMNGRSDRSMSPWQREEDRGQLFPLDDQVGRLLGLICSHDARD